MRVTLDYGRTGLNVTLPDDRTVGPLAIREAAPLVDPAGALEEALRNPIGTRPLAELARGKKSACIVICDITRPVPNKLILPPVLRTLEASGIPRDQIVILNATGLHRPNEGAEMVEMVGEKIARTYRIDWLDRETRVHVDLLSGNDQASIGSKCQRNHGTPWKMLKQAPGSIFRAGGGGRHLRQPLSKQGENRAQFFVADFEDGGVAHGPRQNLGRTEWHPQIDIANTNAAIGRCLHEVSDRCS